MSHARRLIEQGQGDLVDFLIRAREADARGDAWAWLVNLWQAGRLLPPPAQGGRGQRVDDELGLSSRERSDLRAIGAIPLDTFADWLDASDAPTFAAARQLARAERRRRDPRAWLDAVLFRLDSLLDLCGDAPEAFTQPAIRLSEPITAAHQLAEELRP